MSHSLRNVFSTLKNAARSRRSRIAKPGLETLETRLTPYFGAATYLWNALGDQTTWNDPMNWSHVDPTTFSPVSGTPTPYSNIIFPPLDLLPRGSPSTIDFNFSDINFPMASLTVEDSYTFTGNSIEVDGSLSLPDSFSALGGPTTATFLLSGVTLGLGAAVDPAASATVQLGSATDPTGLVLTLGGEIDKTGPGQLIIDTQTIQYPNSAAVLPIPFALLGGVTELAASTNMTGIGFQISGGASLQIADNAAVTVGPISGSGTIQLLGTSAAGDATSLAIFVSAAVVDSFTGSIIGQGQLVTTGFGTLVLSSIDFGGVGTVTAQSGTLDVNGPISAGALQMGPLGTLGGLGEWTISGPVVFLAGSTLNVTIDGTTPGTGYTQIADASTQGVNLGGAKLTATLGYEYQAGDLLTIIASSLVTGSFANVVRGTVFLGPSVPFAVSSAGGVTISPLQSITTTTLESSQNPSNPGMPVTLTAVVSTRTTSVSEGLVSFLENGNVVAGSQVSNGQASYTTTLPTVGAAVFQAVYSGYGPDLGSSSGAFSQAIAPFTTTTVIGSVDNPSPLGSPTEFVALVETPSGPVTTGSVAFRRGNRLLGVAPLNQAGYANLVVSGLLIGTVRVQAIYQGDANHLGSVSPVLVQRIGRVSTMTTLTLDTFTTRKGRTRYALVAQVAITQDVGLIPLGMVVFKANNRVLGHARLKNRQAVVVFGPRPILLENFIAYYRGGPHFLPSEADLQGVV